MLTKHKNYVLFLLSRREYSRQELSQKLLQRKASQLDIQSIFDYLDKYQYQSDERYAEQLVRSQISKLNGENKILQMAFQKGIDEVLIKKCIEKIEIDWDALAHECYQKKHGTTSEELDWSDKQKHMRYLVSKGFSFDVSRQVVEEYIK